MKITTYLGAEGDSIVIKQPTDIYPLLDWCHSQMIENQEKCKGTINIEKWQKAIDYLSELMDKVESDGFGCSDDVDSIEY